METPQELSWLQFNRRVLDQTRRTDFPTLERLRFLSIWASNMDEFFSARIWRPFVQGRRTAEYQALLQEARAQVQRAESTYRAFLPELERLGIRIVPARTLTRAERAYFGAFLAEEVAPRTDVLRVEALREVRSRALYFASGDGVLEHLLRVPDSIPRLVEIPGRENTYVRLGELLRLRADLFLAGRTARLHELRVVRLAAIDQMNIDWDELPAALESRLEGQVEPPGGRARVPAPLGGGHPAGVRPGARGGGEGPAAARPALPLPGGEPRAGPAPLRAPPRLPGAGLRPEAVRPHRPG